MGAIKTNNYSEKEQELYLIARAFANPARIRMVQLLKNGSELRNIDLCEALNLSKPTVKSHIRMLNEAGLLNIQYLMHCYKISLNDKGNLNTDLILEMV